MFTIEELVEEFGVSKRTIREYIQLGILPRPLGRTYAARYTNVHRNRLAEIAHARRGDRSRADWFDRFNPER